MIEFSCHTWTFSDLTLPEALGTIARLGFRYVDVGLAASKAPSDARRAAQEIKNDLLLYNLRLADLYLMLPRISLPDERRDHDIETFKGLLPLAQALETPGITPSPGVKQEDDGAFERAADALRTMVSAAQAINLRVSIEPHVESMASTPEAALRLLETVPGLELTLDWAQMVYNNSTREAILSLLPKTRHVQIRQAARGHLQTPFDQGKIDLARVVADLKAVNYGGAICVEIVNTPGRYGITKVSAVGESVRLRDALREARG
ncbi:MAG TPA: sugar phosphate isomerase/epimerase family protein [Phototrophicaceae bacterium]|nr:sugar phosphate isomerase/epimerase family protein [Phototrophicaceae bacterium]